MNAYDVALAFLDEDVETVPLNRYKRPLLKFSYVPITREFVVANADLYYRAPMLAVLCRGLWCIDIDIDILFSKNGFESIKGIPEYDEFLINASETWVQKTPSGGMHYVFRKKSNITYGQKIDYLPSVDIKAHHNNYFVLGGSVSNKGKYELNGKEPTFYHGELEEHIFKTEGNYENQVMQKYSARSALEKYGFEHLIREPKGQGLGRQAYDRIIKGTSTSRNEDLYKAFSYAKACNVTIEPLKAVIGTVKGKDEFTEREFYATMKSAFK